MNRMYCWYEFNDHSWLARDKEGYVAVVRCAVGYALPKWISIPWKYFSNLDLKVQHFVLHLLGFQNPTRDDIQSCTDEMIRECGLYLLDFPFSPDGQFMNFDYEQFPKKPLHVSQLPPSLQAVTNYFTLPNHSFECMDKVCYTDWVCSVTDVQTLRIGFVENKLEYGFGMGNDVYICDIPKEYTPGTFFRTSVRFLENSKPIDDPFYFAPSICDWRCYLTLYSVVLDELHYILGADTISITWQGRDYKSIEDFRKSVASLGEYEPAKKILFMNGQRLLATIILDTSPLIELTGNGSACYSMSIYTYDDFSEQIHLMIRNACARYNIPVSQKDPEPDPCASRNIFFELRDVFRDICHELAHSLRGIGK